MIAVCVEYDVAPCCISGAIVVDVDDFAAYAASRGCVGVTDNAKYGGNIEYRNSDRCAHPAFIVKISGFADRAAAEVAAEAIRIAGRSTH